MNAKRGTLNFKKICKQAFFEGLKMCQSSLPGACVCTVEMGSCHEQDILSPLKQPAI